MLFFPGEDNTFATMEVTHKRNIARYLMYVIFFSVIALVLSSFVIFRSGVKTTTELAALLFASGAFIAGIFLFVLLRKLSRRFNVLENLEQEYISNVAIENQPASLSLLPGFIYRCKNDNFWTMIHLSESFKKITGYDAEDIIDNKVISYSELIQPEYRQLVQDELYRSISINELYELIYKITTSSGEERWVWERGKARKDADGNVLWLDGYIEDITKLKRYELELVLENKKLMELENSLELSERGYQDLINSMKETVIICDYNGLILDINNTAVKELGYSRNELVNSYFTRINPVLTIEQIKAKLLKAKIGHAELFETMRRTKDGREFPVEASLSEIKYHGIEAVLSISRDISVRKQEEKKRKNAEALQNILYSKLLSAKEKAEESDRLKSAFLANMSHEIRTPMNGILGFLELLNTPGLSEENRNEYGAMLNASSKRLLDTINDILELSTIQSGDMQIQRQLVDLNATMHSYYELYVYKADEKKLKLKIGTIPDKADSVGYLDTYKIDKILGVLFRNAIKFTDYGEIEFGATRKGDELTFYVRDTGPGIPKERQKSIFDRFIQVDIGFNREHEGAGLGLSIAKTYVEALKGNIWVESEPGNGAVFYFTVPFTSEKETEQEVNGLVESVTDAEIANSTTASQVTKPEKQRTIKILIAEDDDISYRFLQRAIKGKEFKLLRVINGEDAVRIIRDYTGIDIVLMDIKMPLMDGLEATRLIREFNSSIPIIAQTAHTLSGDREESLNAGCNDYISKPINRSELISKILHFTHYDASPVS